MQTDLTGIRELLDEFESYFAEDLYVNGVIYLIREIRINKAKRTLTEVEERLKELEEQREDAKG